MAIFAQSSTSAYRLGQLFRLRTFVCPVYVWALQSRFSTRLCPLTSGWVCEWEGRCVPAPHLSLGSGTQPTLLPKEMGDIGYDLTQISTCLPSAPCLSVLNTFSPISKNVQDNPGPCLRDPYFLLSLGWHFIIYSSHTCVFIFFSLGSLSLAYNHA